MGKNYNRGRGKEFEVVHFFRERAYYAQRMAGSRGLWDIHAYWPGGEGRHHYLVQVKYSKTGTPSRYQDANFHEFAALPVDENTIKEVWVYTKGVGTPEIIAL